MQQIEKYPNGTGFITEVSIDGTVKHYFQLPGSNVKHCLSKEDASCYGVE